MCSIRRRPWRHRSVALEWVPAPTEARALGYRVTVPRGRRLSIAVDFDAATPAPSQAPFFVDLLRVRTDEPPRPVASMPPGRRSLIHDVDEPGDYIVRAQAELAASGRATVAIRTLASLPFPIADVERRGMQSVFGEPRGGGTRSHEALDIMAARGTPVLSADEGRVAKLFTPAKKGGERAHRLTCRAWTGGTCSTTRTSTATRDGLAEGANVKKGEVLGYVGSTGDASPRRAAPALRHLSTTARSIPGRCVQPDQAVPAISATSRPPRRNPAVAAEGEDVLAAASFGAVGGARHPVPPARCPGSGARRPRG